MRFEGELFAIEGSHRIAAAYHLGIIPKVVIEEVECSDETDKFWRDIRAVLPQYTFEHVLKLEMADFRRCT